jgi:hypothetical protein
MRNQGHLAATGLDDLNPRLGGGGRSMINENFRGPQVDSVKAQVF